MPDPKGAGKTRIGLLGSRDHGARNDRQKGRLLWLVEMWGADKFRDMVSELMGVTLAKGVEEKVDLWKPVNRHEKSSCCALCILHGCHQ